MKILFSLVCFLACYQTASAALLRSAYQQNLCLDINQDSSAGWRYQSNVEVWPCNANDNQQFGFSPLATVNGRASFVLQIMGKCLDVDLGQTQPWTQDNNVQIFNCNGGVNQQFVLEPRANGWFQIRSAWNDRCLDIDLNQANGWRFERNVQLWTCSGQPNQLWRFDTVPNDGGIIIEPRF